MIKPTMDDLTNEYTLQLIQTLATMREEIDDLKAALCAIRDYPEGEDGRLDSMEAIAREALGEFNE